LGMGYGHNNNYNALIISNDSFVSIIESNARIGPTTL
jgi:hypothetical protein